MNNDRLTSVLASWQSWGIASQAPKLEDLQPLAGGLTNKGYLLTLNQQQYLLRLAAPNTKSLNINRSAELALQQFLAKKDLAAKVIYTAPDDSFWLREYIVGEAISLPNSATDKFNLALQLAKHLQQIHQLEIPASLAKQLTHISIEEKATAYWQAIDLEKLSSQELARLRQLQEQIFLLTGKAVLNNKKHLCHLDPTLGNWLITVHQQLHLLDWEYAGLGNPLWDFAQLSQAFCLNEQQEKQLLARLGYCPEKSNPAWQLAKLEMRYLDSLWFALQASS